MGFADKFGGNKGGGSGDDGDNNSGAGGGGFSNKFAGNRPSASRAEKFTDTAEPREATKSFADKAAKQSNNKSFTDQVTRRSDLVYLVHGKDRGKDAWHYVLVDKNKLPMFLKQIETGSIDVALYGEVLRSGWGKQPPEDIVKEIEDEFGN
tara:strand:+ start:738 stop:1190 length:453 start_codon:yes stop_codon:yes gene_type:complete